MSVIMNVSTFATNQISKQLNGSFEVVVGGYDVMNSRGEYYVYDDDIQNFFDGLLKERIADGLQGEKNHPSMRAGESFEDFKQRAIMIDVDNVSHTFEKAEIGKPITVDGQPTLVRPVRAIIKPDGVHGEELYNSLNGASDTAFSVRSFTKNVIKNGTLYRYYDIIVVWDWVHAPGINFARKSKWGNVLKQFQVVSNMDITYTENDLNMMRKSAFEAGFESDTKLLDSILAFNKRCESGCIYSGLY